MMQSQSHVMAVRIQRKWKAFMDVRIYRYYRDLINFRERGLPNQLLRCVNPAEAKFLDAASGTHVRFRLAGLTFPPTIMYRVYCHVGLTDIGAFAPRDYTQNESKKAAPRHTKPAPGTRLPTRKVRARLFLRPRHPRVARHASRVRSVQPPCPTHPCHAGAADAHSARPCSTTVGMRAWRTMGGDP